MIHAQVNDVEPLDSETDAQYVALRRVTVGTDQVQDVKRRGDVVKRALSTRNGE